jgi:hypothetical protein
MSQIEEIYLKTIYEAADLFRKRQQAKGYEVSEIKQILGKAKHDGKEGVTCIVMKKIWKNPLGSTEPIYYFITLRTEFWNGWSHILNEAHQIPRMDLHSFGETILDRTVDEMRKFMQYHGTNNVVYDMFFRNGVEHYIKTNDLIDNYFEKYNSWATHLKYKHIRDCWGYPERMLFAEDPFT